MLSLMEEEEQSMSLVTSLNEVLTRGRSVSTPLQQHQPKQGHTADISRPS